MKITSEHKRHRDLHELGGLDAADTEREPPARAVSHVAEQGDPDQHHEDQHKGGKSVAHEGVRRHPGRDPHQGEREEHVERLSADPSGRLIGCAVERGEAEREDAAHDGKQRPVDPGREPLEKAPDHLSSPRVRAACAGLSVRLPSR